MRLVAIEDGRWVWNDPEFFRIRDREGFGDGGVDGFYNDTGYGRGKSKEWYTQGSTTSRADGGIPHYNCTTGSTTNESLCGVGKPVKTYTWRRNDPTI